MRMVIWLHERAGSAPSPFSRLSMPALGQQTPGTAPAVVPAQGPDGWEEEWGVAGRGASGTVRRSKCPMPTAMAHKTRSCAVSSIRVPGCPCACARRAFSRSGAPSILTSSCCRRSSLSLRTIAESSAAGVVHSDSRWGGAASVRVHPCPALVQDARPSIAPGSRPSQTPSARARTLPWHCSPSRCSCATVTVNPLGSSGGSGAAAARCCGTAAAVAMGQGWGGAW
jgi:hypothetical protein